MAPCCPLLLVLLPWRMFKSAFTLPATNLLLASYARLRHLNSTAAVVRASCRPSCLPASSTCPSQPDISQFRTSIKWKFYNFTSLPLEGIFILFHFALSCGAFNLMRFYLLTVDNRRAARIWWTNTHTPKIKAILMRFWALYEACFMAALVAVFGVGINITHGSE